MMILFLLLMITMPFVKSYPFGAPPGICTFDEPMPNHMAKSAQTTTLPFEISMSKDQVTSVDDSITVSIKSKPGGPTFKGFLVLPKDDNGPIGTWDNDETSHPIEGCSATTHDNKTPKDKVLLIWRPGTKLPKGRIRMTAVIVQQFDLFWINIPVPVQGSAVSSPQSTQNPISSSVTTPTTKIPPIGGVSLPGLVFTTVSTPPGSKVTKSSAQSEVITAGTVRQVEISTQKGNFNPETTTSGTTTTTTKVTTTKRKSLISRIFGGSKEKTTTSTTTTTTPKPTTTSPVTTTKGKSLIRRIFGGGEEKTTTTTTTTITTTLKPTTISAITTTKGQSFIRRLFGGKTSTPTSSTVETATQTEELVPTTTKPSSFVKRLFG